MTTEIKILFSDQINQESIFFKTIEQNLIDVWDWFKEKSFCKTEVQLCFTKTEILKLLEDTEIPVFIIEWLNEDLINYWDDPNYLLIIIKSRK